MKHKIKVGAVSYLNTKPLLYGIERSEIFNDIDLILEYPALLAKHLREGAIDMALMPVAAMKDIEEARIVSDYGIAADGDVASVCIFSHVPMDEIQTVYLDYQSRTSVKLAEVLLKHYWKKEVEFLPATENYIEYINDTKAGVIIGDRALKQLSNFPYIYDLATAWKDFTGLPFVFAAWISNKDLPPDFTAAFNKANAEGLQHIDEVVKQNSFPYFDLKEYYTRHIHYFLDESKKQGLQKFLSFL
ncbi:MAG TPA: menaquinone biosynthesis protein [Flavipsychrobacter sp.]|nr:menaquinone biosynthesis protein [Flavipsychrobacter sp.]